MIRRIALLAVLVAAVAAPVADAATATWSVTDLENQLMCPVCHTLLNDSQSTAANRIREIIQQKHDAGWSETRTRNYLVAQYGEEILAAPPTHGFDLLAWLIPGAVLLGGAVIAVALARTWSRSRADEPAPQPPDDAMSRRIDAELAGDDG
jgi:cytochrome c-type biogenesis protein CcmH/NrfF